MKKTTLVSLIFTVVAIILAAVSFLFKNENSTSEEVTWIVVVIVLAVLFGASILFAGKNKAVVFVPTIVTYFVFATVVQTNNFQALGLMIAIAFVTALFFTLKNAKWASGVVVVALALELFLMVMLLIDTCSGFNGNNELVLLAYMYGGASALLIAETVYYLAGFVKREEKAVSTAESVNEAQSDAKAEDESETESE